MHWNKRSPTVVKFAHHPHPPPPLDVSQAPAEGANQPPAGIGIHRRVGELCSLDVNRGSKGQASRLVRGL